ncbi:MAG: Uncharacterized protein CEN91_63 [Candidatus Berkelbacteria bacterium Licking1014_85]|uniref:Uncharacterized protein n=1 Tax=Candidatus Berkelbacteria bacterium Licking1014_85 TaxID=2017148 RepID=A0A554LM23_9BACT|nr:MAG: Uncharacterized protein CEN91_63 [Candidatus Berkelbacteria bacterium Licking1014_85]
MIKSKKIILLVILALFVWFLRPFFHSFAMIGYVSPLRLILVLVVLFILFSIYKQIFPLKMIQKGLANYAVPTKPVSWRGISFLSVVLILILFLLSFENAIRYRIIANQTDYASRQSLPEISPLRLVPKPVAQRFASDSFQNPQEHLGDSQIVLINDKLTRVFPRLPDGIILFLTKKLNGFVTVNIDTLEKQVKIEDQKFTYSEGIGILDNIYFQLLKKKYFITYSNEPIYLKNAKEEWITVVPYINYRGFPFRVPYWGGVMIVASNGEIINLTPEQAQELNYLEGNRIYPKELSKIYAESYAYKGGLINYWFLHKNQTEIVSLPTDETVIHQATKEGLKQILVAEPFGRSYGIYKIFIFDATTGKREIIEYDQNSQLTGPVSAADYIKKAFPTYDWTYFQLSEPRPITMNNNLYWLLSVIPSDSAGIASTVFFDAKTNNVIKADNEAQINEFLSTQKISSTPQAQNSSANSLNSADQINQIINNLQSQLDELKKLVK